MFSTLSGHQTWLENLPLDALIFPIILHVLGYFPATFEAINIVPQGLKEGKKSVASLVYYFLSPLGCLWGEPFLKINQNPWEGRPPTPGS